MPRRDETGPMTGRGLGLCTGVNAVKHEAGLGMRLGFARRRGFGRGFGRGFAVNELSSKTQKNCFRNKKIYYKTASKLLISN